MNAAMRQAFQNGSGVDPAVFKATLVLIAVAVTLLVCAWVVTQLMDAYRNQRLSGADLAYGSVKLIVLASFLMFVLV